MLLVVPQGSTDWDELVEQIKRAIRSDLSPRHVPDRIHRVSSIPRTVSGKKMELPVKRILSGQPIDKVANPGAMANPESLAEVENLSSCQINQVK